MLTILASGSKTSGGTQPINVAHLEDVIAAVFLLDVSNSSTSLTGESLSVFVQSGPDSTGAIWDDFVKFNPVATTSGASRQVAAWERRAGAPEQELRYPSDAALAAGVLQGPTFVNWRLKWTTPSTSAAYTFSVGMDLVRAVRA